MTTWLHSDKKRDLFSSNELDYSIDSAEEMEFSEEFLRAKRVKAHLRRKTIKSINKTQPIHMHHKNKNNKKNKMFEIEKKYKRQLKKHMKQG